MKKKIIILPILIAGVVFLSGCANSNQAGSSNKSESTTASTAVENNLAGACEKGEVVLEGYGDPGKRLKNCFVEYPGEPSRQDKSYYIVEDICGQFTKEFVENALGQKIAKIETPKIAGSNSCKYYISDKENVELVLNYLNIENQKKGQELMGRKMVKESKIPIDNFVCYQEDGIINSIYFILSPGKFISVQRTQKANLSSDELIDFSAKIGEAIKNYK